MARFVSSLKPFVSFMDAKCGIQTMRQFKFKYVKEMNPDPPAMKQGVGGGGRKV